MKKTFVFLLIGIFLISFVSASSEVYQQDTNIDLKIPCLNNNTYCSPTTTCNITVLDSEDVIIVNNQLMDNQGAYHNYTINKTNSQNSGEFSRNVICSDSNNLGYASDTFIITPTGNAFDQSSSLMSALVLFLMFGITIFFLVFSKLTTNPGIQLFFTMIGYLTMTLTVGASWILLQSLGVQSNLSILVKSLMYIVGFVLMVIMYYIFINQTKHALKLMKAKRGFGDIEDDDF